jgi:hypothetical protein
MKEAIFIFSFNREEMLKKVVESVKDYNYFIIDDGSTFDWRWDDARFWKLTHQGKEQWHLNWDLVFRNIKSQFMTDELFVFTPDDFLDLNIAKIFELHEKYKDKPYVYNIVRDHRDYCWNHKPVIDIDSETQQIGFVVSSATVKYWKCWNLKLTPLTPRDFATSP